MACTCTCTGSTRLPLTLIISQHRCDSRQSSLDVLSVSIAVYAKANRFFCGQGKPAPARRKKAALLAKSKLGPGKILDVPVAGAELPVLACSTAARQPSQLRPPLYPSPAKEIATGHGLLPVSAGLHISPRFSGEVRHPAGRASAQLGPAAKGSSGAGPGHTWAALPLPNGILGPSSAHAFSQTESGWLDPQKAAAAPGCSHAPHTMGSADPTWSSMRPWQNRLGKFLPHPQRRRSEYPRRCAADSQAEPHELVRACDYNACCWSPKSAFLISAKHLPQCSGALDTMVI
jgi:hypothetical protein